MLDLQTKCCPRPSASGNILSSGPTYHMLPSSPVNNCIMLIKGNKTLRKHRENAQFSGKGTPVCYSKIRCHVRVFVSPAKHSDT